MPSIEGMLSSIGPAVAGPGLRAELERAPVGNAASFTRNAIAQAEGPCLRANACANESGFGIDDES